MSSIHSVPTIYGLLSVPSYHWSLLISKYTVIIISNNPDQRKFCIYEEILSRSIFILVSAHLCEEKQVTRAKIGNYKVKSSSLVRVISNLAF